MKRFFILVAIFAITTGAMAQLKVRNDGVVTINAQTQDWWPALRITVPTQLSCAYNLWNTYYNQDVFYVRGDGYSVAWKGHLIRSDVMFKKNITPIEGSLRKITRLQGVRYQYIDGKEYEDGEESNEDFHLGFIAQDVEAIFPEAVKDMHDGTKAMSYTDLIPVLVEAIKEQQSQIEQLQAMVYDRGHDVMFLMEQIDACCQQNAENPTKTTSVNENNIQKAETAKLFQNVPNPFSSNTEIRFEIPENSNTAKLLIHDMQGAEIKSYTITARGAGTIMVQGHELPAGMYMYTLLVNNTIVDTKKMILTK
ncbi:MAG: tail fiber domain-containing protein [Bacteroidales bacterium]|nr:tail fiber domain-containing protein [Bacteroidales bacterium]